MMPLHQAKSLADPLRPICGVESMWAGDNFGPEADTAQSKIRSMLRGEGGPYSRGTAPR